MAGRNINDNVDAVLQFEFVDLSKVIIHNAIKILAILQPPDEIINQMFDAAVQYAPSKLSMLIARGWDPKRSACEAFLNCRYSIVQKYLDAAITNFVNKTEWNAYIAAQQKFLDTIFV